MSVQGPVPGVPQLARTNEHFSLHDCFALALQHRSTHTVTSLLLLAITTHKKELSTVQGGGVAPDRDREVLRRGHGVAPSGSREVLRRGHGGLQVKTFDAIYKICMPNFLKVLKFSQSSQIFSKFSNFLKVLAKSLPPVRVDHQGPRSPSPAKFFYTIF